jgi:hypothetical protein
MEKLLQKKLGKNIIEMYRIKETETVLYIHNPAFISVEKPYDITIGDTHIDIINEKVWVTLVKNTELMHICIF